MPMIHYEENLRCTRCGRTIAEADGCGGLRIGGVPMATGSGACPECGEPWKIAAIAEPIFNAEQLSVIRLYIEEIRTAGKGHGSLVIDFKKMGVCAITSYTGKKRREFNL